MLNKAIISIGRWQGLHLGHDKIINCVIEESIKNKCQPIIFIVDGIITGKDKNKNPLSGYRRLNIMKSIYPNVRFEVISSVYEIEDILYIIGYELEMVICGSDRLDGYRKYFENVKMMSIYRDENIEEGIEGISGTKVREMIRDNNINEYIKIFPSNNISLIKEIFKEIRGDIK